MFLYVVDSVGGKPEYAQGKLAPCDSNALIAWLEKELA